MTKKTSNLSKTLKKLLFDKDMKPVDLAREVNLPQPTIHRLVTGKSARPFQSSLKPIADFFSISIEQLMGETNTVISNPWETDTSSDNNKVYTIPILAWSNTLDLNKTKKSSKHSIVTTGNISPHCFALIAQDHSMEPLFAKNSILIFDPERKPTDKSYVLIKLNNMEQPIFRQLLIDIDKFYIRAINSTLYPAVRELNDTDNVIATVFESRVNHITDIEHALEETP